MLAYGKRDVFVNGKMSGNGETRAACALQCANRACVSLLRLHVPNLPASNVIVVDDDGSPNGNGKYDDVAGQRQSHSIRYEMGAR